MTWPPDSWNPGSWDLCAHAAAPPIPPLLCKPTALAAKKDDAGLATPRAPATSRARVPAPMDAACPCPHDHAHMTTHVQDAESKQSMLVLDSQGYPYVAAVWRTKAELQMVLFHQMR